MQEKVTTKMALMFPLGFPGGSDGNKSTCNAGDPGLIPGLGPTPVFLSGEFHGQRSLESYSPWGCKESDWATNTFTFSLTKLKQAFFLKLRPLGSFYFGRLVNFFSLPFWNVNLFNSLLVLQPRKVFLKNLGTLLLKCNQQRRLPCPYFPATEGG